jgi:CheY-like chemotaxis protein
VAPEILIVGDPTARAGLVRQIRAGGYAVSLCAPPDLDARMAGGRLPGAIVVCLDDVQPEALMRRLRNTRLGAAVPVTLYGPLGGPVGDLADVLDLGADHFLEAPADDAALLAALEELAGPATAEPEERPWHERSAGGGEISRPYRTEVLDEGSASSRSASAPGLRGSDPVIGQLHRTLDMLEERLREGDGSRRDVREDFDLDDLGLDAVPEVEIDPGDSQDRLSAEQFDLPMLGGSQRSNHAHGTRAGSPEATVLLEESGPILGIRAPFRRTGTASGSGLRARRTDPGTQHELGSDPVPAPPRDRPRRSSPLPVERQGALDTVEVPRLLWMLHRAHYTGRLTLERGRVEKQLWLDNGDLVFARSNVGQDRLTDGLLRRGVLTRTQYETARRLAAKEPRRAGQLLVESGFLKPTELHDILRTHLMRIVDSTFPWTDGTWALEPDETTREPVTLTESMAVVLAEGIRQRMDARQLYDLLGGPDQYPRLRTESLEGGGTRALAESLRLSAGEEAWLPRLDGQRSLRRLAADPGTDELELLALVYALHVIGHVDTSGEPPPVPGIEHDPSRVDEQRIRERLQLAREADYFALLGLPRDACRLDVRRAHLDLARVFAPDALEPRTRDRFADELAELRAALDEARDVLSDDAMRSAYLAHLREPEVGETLA